MDPLLHLKLKESLKQAGYKCTPERLLIIETMLRHQSPLSPVELSLLTSDTIAESTVYRNISILEKVGALVRVYTGWKFKLELSENYRSHHHHMTCINCGMVIEFEESKNIESELSHLADIYSFKLQQHTLEIRGLCQNCQ